MSNTLLQLFKLLIAIVFYIQLRSTSRNIIFGCPSRRSSSQGRLAVLPCQPRLQQLPLFPIEPQSAEPRPYLARPPPPRGEGKRVSTLPLPPLSWGASCTVGPRERCTAASGLVNCVHFVVQQVNHHDGVVTLGFQHARRP